jgi:DNA-binding Lrp family transcriptional regulator
MSTKKEEQFLMVPYTILQNKELKDGDKMTLSLIYSFHNNNKEMYMSNNKLGYMLGVSRTTASERVTKLETLGYIKCERVMVNGKERRTIVPLRMVSIPNELVGTPNVLVGSPNPLVGEPNSISRYSDTSLVGGVGSIIYPLLDNELNNELHTLPHKELDNQISLEEELEQISIQLDLIKGIDNPDVNETRGQLTRQKYQIKNRLKELETQQ